MPKHDADGYNGEIIVVYGMGFVWASIISFALNKSVWWMMLHGLLSWFYLGYLTVLKYGVPAFRSAFNL